MNRIAALFLVVAVVLLVGCLPKAPSLPGGQPPVISSFDADPPSITKGESATLSWNVSGATKVSIEPDVGSVALTGRRMVSPAMTTAYTLTAVNEAGTVTATARVVVAAASPAPTPPSVSLPSIDSFAANPGTISPGGSSTLSWSVSGATSVTISGGIGSVGLSGSTTVSPASTTTYMLTASNAAGSVTATTQVIVAAPSPPVDTTPPSVPILVSPASGALLPQKTAPWSFTWSPCSDPESGINQYQIQVYRAGQTPLIDEYTPANTYSRVVEVAYGNLSNWHWKVRAQNNAGLWSVWSTEGSFTVEPRVAYDFIEKAPTAYWWSKVGEQLPFPGNLDDSRGFACYRTNIKLSNGATYSKILETHPRWVDNGWISGKYSGVYIPSGARLRVKVGIVSGGAAGKVRFYASKLNAVASWDAVVAYGDGVKEAEVDLGAYVGQTIDFVIGVNAEGSSGQDWAAWVEARIVY